MRARVLVVICTVAICAPAAADKAFVTGETLFKLCDAQQRLAAAPTNELVDPQSAYEAYECRYYVAAVADAMSASASFRDCIPRDAKSDDLIRMVHVALARNRGLWKLSGFKGAVAAIAEGYRCTGPGKP